MDYPLVSAIALTNEKTHPYIGLLIKSFNQQTYPYKELVIVNNCSSQLKASELNIEATPNVFIFDTPATMSAGMARNYGISVANGPIIAQFDSDSYHFKERLEAQISSLTEKEKVCVLSRCLSYSFCSGEAEYWYNKSGLILNSMVFIRPADVDYPDVQKGEEDGFISRLSTGVVNVENKLICKWWITSEERASGKVINKGLHEREFRLVQDLVSQLP